MTNPGPDLAEQLRVRHEADLDKNEGRLSRHQYHDEDPADYRTAMAGLPKQELTPQDIDELAKTHEYPCKSAK